MGLYTKLDKQIDNYYEVDSVNRRLSKPLFYLKVIVLVLFIFNVFLTIKRKVQFIHNAITFLDDFLFNPSLFISSVTLESGNPILFPKNSILISFCSISISISSIVSSIIFIACSKTSLWIKALCPSFHCVEYDSLLYYAMFCDISFCTFKSFF